MAAGEAVLRATEPVPPPFASASFPTSDLTVLFAESGGKHPRRTRQVVGFARGTGPAVPVSQATGRVNLARGDNVERL